MAWPVRGKESNLMIGYFHDWIATQREICLWSAEMGIAIRFKNGFLNEASG